jgi:hypothetical protein
VGSIEGNNKLTTNYTIQRIKENNLRFSKHIQNSLLHGTQSSKVVGLSKVNNILTTNYTIQTKYRK